MSEKMHLQKFPFVRIMFVFSEEFAVCFLYIHEVDTNPHFECPKRSLPRLQVTYVRFSKQISPQKKEIIWPMAPNCLVPKENHRFGSCFFFRFLSLQVFRGVHMLIFGVHPIRLRVAPDTSGDSRMRMFVKASSAVLGRNLNGVSWFP